MDVQIVLIPVATERYLNGGIYSHLVGQLAVLHLNTIQFEQLAVADMTLSPCTKPADKTELL